MAWGFWSASTVSDRGRSPRRATTATASMQYYQPQTQPQQQQQAVQAQQQQQQLQQQAQQQVLQQPQCTMNTMNQCVQQQQPQEDPIVQYAQPIAVQQQQKQGQMTSVCGSPCQSVCHSPTCHSPSCQSGTTESPEPQQQCSDCQEPSCQYNLMQQQAQQELQELVQQQQQQQQQQAQQAQQVQQAQQQYHLQQTPPPHIHQVHYTYSRRTSLDSNALDTNQLTDIICRAVQPSIQSANNTLTRNASLRDTGDYAIPQPHPHHHIITTTKSTTSLIRCGSCPGSTGVSRRGSSSESSPAGTVGNASVIGGSDGGGAGGYHMDYTGHYDRMPIPIPIVPVVTMGSMHSEDEIEPAYATVFPNTIIQHHANTLPHTMSLSQQQLHQQQQQQQQQINYQTEDRSIYRRGARRWRKLYRINGHIFQAKRFNRKAFCTFCHDRIWGLGKQGFKCIQCKLLVHKKCHKLVQRPCGKDYSDGITTDSGEELNGNNEMPSQYTYHCDLSDCSQNYMSDEPEIECVQTPIQKQYCLDDFELIKVIGRGSYAKVLMVELKKTRRIYAMKVIKKALVTDDEDIDWVQTEKHVFETASNHPFLVGLHSCFQTPSRLFFVIEFVRGGDLMFHMQRQRRLPEEHARFYAAEISLALNFLHEKGIIYRDLKLDNVLLDHEGHIKLTDYGMCKEGIGAGDKTSTFCGTPNYIAPEILRGEDYGFSVDWWALGVLLYEMLCGRSPFDISGIENAEQAPNICQSRKRRSIHSSSFLQTTEDFLFQVILEKAIRIPRSLSVKSASVLKGFLNKSPGERLGCQQSGFLDIVNHQFFKTIDWEMLEQKQVMPPFQPRLENDRDLTNFPPEFTDEPVHLTPDEDRIIEKIDQSEFEGFEYVNPLLMTFDDCV